MRFLFIVSLLHLVICNSLGQLFTDAARISGVIHSTSSVNLLGGGICFSDIDNDGFDDLYIIGGGQNDGLFINLGNGKFRNITKYAGVDNTDYFKTTGVSSGDINNDGLRDFFITTDRQNEDILYLNLGNGKFQNISNEAGINIKIWSTAATFIDYDNDGFLDIYVIGYIKDPSPLLDNNDNVIGFNHTCYENIFYHNNGDNTFTEIGSEIGVDNAGCGLAVTILDLDKDLNSEIYVVNDFGDWVLPNVYYNNINATFIDESIERGLDIGIYGMGIAQTDVNKDGFTDLYVTNLGKNAFLTNNGYNQFADETQAWGVENTYVNDNYATSWGTLFFDYDNDGDDDLAVINGYIPSSNFIPTSEYDPNKLYTNTGSTFEDVSDSLGFNDGGISRGGAFSDYDLDGDIDVAITKLNILNSGTDNTLLLKNNLIVENNFLKLKIEGKISNKDGLGAHIIAYYNNTQTSKYMDGGSSHASKNSNLIHFGLGNSLVVDSLIVRWPSGTVDKVTDLAANQIYYLLEGSNQFLKAGCMDLAAQNFDMAAEYNFGCYMDATGCTDYKAANFNMKATSSSNTTCVYAGCTKIGAANYNPIATIDDGSCQIVTSTKKDTKDVILLYPNPVKRYAVLRIDGIPTTVSTVALINLNGLRTKLKFSVKFDHLDAEIGDALFGLYILEIRLITGEVLRKYISIQ